MKDLLFKAWQHCYLASNSYSIKIEENDTEILITRDLENNPWVTFRGSEHYLDWIYDVFGLPVTKDGSTYHAGFWLLYHSCRDKLLPLIESNQTVYIMGHSLGAALTAVMNSYETELIGRKVTAVGLAMPKPGYSNLKNTHRLHTVVHPFDPVPMVPFYGGFERPGKVYTLPCKWYHWNPHSLKTYYAGLKDYYGEN